MLSCIEAVLKTECIGGTMISLSARSMDKLSLVLPRVLQKRGLAKHANGALVAHRAAEWVRERLPQLSSFVRVARLKDGVLVLSCSHSVAMQECQGITADLLQFLRLECPFEPIADVRVVRD